MSAIAAATLACFVICTLVAVYIFFTDPRKPANRLFLVMSMAAAGHILVEFGYRQSHSFEEAMQWKRIDFFWVFMLGLLLHFVLALAERTDLLKKKLTYLIIYGPVAVFFVLIVSTTWISSAPTQHDWGWCCGMGTSTLWIALNVAWDFAFFVASLAFAVRAYGSAENRQLRNQYRMFVVGIALVIAGSIAELALTQFGIDVPPLLVFSITGMYLFFAWGVFRHRMFQLSPMTAAETIVTTMTDALFLVGDDGLIMSGNPAAEKMLRYRKGELNGMHITDVFAVEEAIPPWIADGSTQSDPDDDTGSVRHTLDYLETSFDVKTGGTVPVSIACTVLYDNRDRRRGSLVIARDMTDRRRADEELARYRDHLEDLVRTRTAELTASLFKLERETEERQRAQEGRRELEAQLMHSQKMEAVGRLAGSVAHDFNNLLFVITGYTESFLATLDIGDPMRTDIEQMHAAARRAGSLVGQLLAFSRKQAVRPRVVDLNSEIGEIEKILVRLLGADIAFEFARSEAHLRVRIDVGQLQQVITNLVVNARDAMPDGGKLSIETGSFELTDAERAANPEAKAGPHALIRVRDSGHGMNRELLSRIFEPFFTTKGRGKGTGLGLSTVYGIVKQSGGFVSVRSEPGKGTTFEIALPQTADPLELEQADEMQIQSHGQERILLVEDDEVVRRLIKRLLQRQGYRVEEARSAEDAVKIFEGAENEIDLLFTDVVMPGMNGKQLSERLLAHRPSLRVLYMSAHTDDLITRYGITGFNEKLLQKPFTANELSSKVREALEA